MCVEQGVGFAADHDLARQKSGVDLDHFGSCHHVRLTAREWVL